MKADKPKRARAAERTEIGFLEALARRCPDDPDILKALGDLYTKVGRHEDGLHTDLALSRLCPREPLVWYNLACSYALLAARDDALTALQHAADLGYRDHGWIRQDADLAALRDDPRFVALVERLQALSPRPAP